MNKHGRLAKLYSINISHIFLTSLLSSLPAHNKILLLMTDLVRLFYYIIQIQENWKDLMTVIHLRHEIKQPLSTERATSVNVDYILRVHSGNWWCTV